MARRACNTPKTKHTDRKFGKVFDQIANDIDPPEKKKLNVYRPLSCYRGLPENRPSSLHQFDPVHDWLCLMDKFGLEFSVLFRRMYVILCILISRDKVKIDDFRVFCHSTI